MMHRLVHHVNDARSRDEPKAGDGGLFRAVQLFSIFLKIAILLCREGESPDFAETTLAACEKCA
jgi:hypothetical protein